MKRLCDMMHVHKFKGLCPQMAKKLIASAVVAVALAALARFAFPDAILPDIFRSLGGGFPALQRVGPFPADRQAIDLLFRSRAPVKFSSSPASQWNIMKEWSSLQGFADSVCPRIPTLTNVCACNRTTAGRAYTHVYIHLCCNACAMFRGNIMAARVTLCVRCNSIMLRLRE